MLSGYCLLIFFLIPQCGLISKQRKTKPTVYLNKLQYAIKIHISVYNEFVILIILKNFNLLNAEKKYEKKDVALPLTPRY